MWCPCSLFNHTVLEDNSGLQTLTNSNVAYTTFNPTLNYVSMNTDTKGEKDVIVHRKLQFQQ